MSNRRDTMPQSRAGVPRRRSRRKTEQAAFPTLEPFARRLESLRLARGFTQRTLAARAKISTNHYQDIAHAHANPTVIVVLSLANALGASVVDLFELPAQRPDNHRVVFVEDLKGLLAAHRHLTDIVERIAKDEMRPRSR